MSAESLYFRFLSTQFSSLFQMYLAMSGPESVSPVRGGQVEPGAGADEVRINRAEQRNDVIKLNEDFLSFG